MPNLSAGALCQTAALHRRFWLRVPVELIGMVSRPRARWTLRSPLSPWVATARWARPR